MNEVAVPTAPVPDKYDRAVAFLTQNPHKIYETWNDPLNKPHGCLFVYASSDGHHVSSGSILCGCLTQIRAHKHTAETFDLTNAIRADERIPDSELKITVESLPVLAEWQRRIDRELRNKPQPFQELIQ